MKKKSMSIRTVPIMKVTSLSTLSETPFHLITPGAKLGMDLT
jgi:hypothetical protein